MATSERAMQLAFRVAAVCCAMAAIAVWIVMPRLVQSAYAGTSWRYFNDLIRGQAGRPVEDYLDLLRHLLIAFSTSAIAMGALAFVLSTERGRKAARVIVSPIAPFVVPAIALTWFIARALGSLDLGHFGDEDETIVAAWLIAGGERLYGSLFAHHGPLAYIVAHATYLLTESKDPAPYRVAQWVIVGLGGIAAAASPVLIHWRERLYAASIFLILAAALYPAWNGHLLGYHVQGGVLFFATVSLLLLPLLLGVQIPAWMAAVAGLAMAALVAAAYSLMLPLGLMFISICLLLRAQDRLWRSLKDLIVPVSAGALLMLGLVVGWLAVNGDIVGYFVYHLYFNQVVYLPFTNYTPASTFVQLKFLLQPQFGWHLWAIGGFCLWVFLRTRASVAAGARWPVRVLLLFGALVMVLALLCLNLRSAFNFKMATLQVATVGLLSIAAARCTGPRPGAHIVMVSRIVLSLALCVLILVTRFTMLLGSLSHTAVGWNGEAAAAEKISAASTIQAVQSWVGPSEPVQALVFKSYWYLLTDRKPASGHYYYLPWQAAYHKAPILGRDIDICADLKRVQPEVIFWDRYIVWQRHDLKDYEPCLYELLTTHYHPVDGMPMVLRKNK